MTSIFLGRIAISRPSMDPEPDSVAPIDFSYMLHTRGELLNKHA